MTSYLTRVPLARDELPTVGDKLRVDEVLHITLNGFTKEWGVFVQVINGQGKLPYWECLWSEFAQEEL